MILKLKSKNNMIVLPLLLFYTTILLQELLQVGAKI
jgi:hypothetical protein